MNKIDIDRAMNALLHKRLRSLIAVSNLKLEHTNSSDPQMYGINLKLAYYRGIQKVLTEQGYAACIKNLEDLLELFQRRIDRFMEVYGIGNMPNNEAFGYYAAQQSLLITVRSLIEEFNYKTNVKNMKNG